VIALHCISLNCTAEIALIDSNHEHTFQQLIFFILLHMQMLSLKRLGFALIDELIEVNLTPNIAIHHNYQHLRHRQEKERQ
jgi:hypothetical protein